MPLDNLEAIAGRNLDSAPSSLTPGFAARQQPAARTTTPPLNVENLTFWPLQVNQLEEGDDEVEDMEEVPMDDGHGNVTVARRRKIVFGHIK